MKSRRTGAFLALAVVFFVLGISNRGAGAVYLGVAAAFFVISMTHAVNGRRKHQ